ncbi:MAG: D-alanyl-D-alanine carboxypeptidase, partial [Deltaproteobacteria bacterium]|nr:D-alanyl-D-alanine carboxypeptidase [Deltaproteobacteria bacterium]
IEAVTGQVLFEENADAIGYPASVIKLLDLLIVLEEVRRGTLALTDPITITAEAARMGGSQVYLKEGERFSVEELLYALIVQSANDAAMALALHVGGSRAAFLERMNRRAQELGLTASRFYSVHGLPPGRGQEFDVTTARDMALLARAVTQHQETFRYTSTREHPFRDGSFIVRTHNHLLGSVPGCDGLKTGYIRAGGYSIAATAERNGLRIITVVLGSKQRKVRDLKARTLLDLGYQRAKALGLPPSMPLAAGKAAPSSTAGAGAGAAAVGTAAAPADGRQPAGGGAETGTGSTSPAPPIAVPQVPRLPSLGSPALWGAGGLLTGLLLGYLIFGRLARRRTLL